MPLKWFLCINIFKFFLSMYSNVDRKEIIILEPGFRIRIFFADPDPGKNLHADPDPGGIRGRGLGAGIYIVHFNHFPPPLLRLFFSSTNKFAFFFGVYNPKRCIFKAFFPVFSCYFPPFFFFLFPFSFFPP